MVASSFRHGMMTATRGFLSVLIGPLYILPRPAGRNQVWACAEWPRVCYEGMGQFIAKHAGKLQGTLSCFDRVLFRGYLPFFSGYAMASSLATRQVHRRDVKRFVLTQAYRLKDHARQMAAREGRPDQYFGERTRKEDLARQVAGRDGIVEGLACVFATVEPCRTFSLRWREGLAFIQSARRKCLILYYFMDRDFGLIHVRLQTWFPLQLQVYVNGHEWLARKLAQHGVRYTKHDI